MRNGCDNRIGLSRQSLPGRKCHAIVVRRLSGSAIGSCTLKSQPSSFSSRITSATFELRRSGQFSLNVSPKYDDRSRPAPDFRS